MHHVLLSSLTAAAALAFCSTAAAAGGSFAVEGGTRAEQATVRAALNASAFDWNVLSGGVTIHIGAYPDGGDATPGDVFVDASLLDSGVFSWGVVQHEFGTVWSYSDDPGLDHAQYGCERFASTLAWAYWPSAENSMAPADIAGESGGMSPTAFRALLAQLLGTPTAGNPQARPVNGPFTAAGKSPTTRSWTRSLSLVTSPRSAARSGPRTGSSSSPGRAVALSSVPARTRASLSA